MFDRSAHLYDLLYAFKDYEAEAATLVELIRARNPAAASLLDVTCGTGRHLEMLGATFDDVAGVDLEPALLKVARTRLPGVSLTLADMRTLDLGRTFDAVTCLFSSVGYLGEPDALSQAISRMAGHLSPGGVLVLDGWIKPESWLPGINVHALARDDNGTAAARVIRSRREGNRTHLDMRYLVATQDGFEEAAEEHILTLFTHAEYRRAFAGAGLEPDVVASPMGPDRDQYVAVS
jgi:dTDP-3-amino-3,4,6-trideoxy-alpha-D-glucopyranose N,N-dimethyltransferase